MNATAALPTLQYEFTFNSSQPSYMTAGRGMTTVQHRLSISKVTLRKKREYLCPIQEWCNLARAVAVDE
jgi:hypothetical protein